MTKSWLLDELQMENHVPEILEQLFPFQIWLLKGEMGAGKTTLVRKLCGVIGSEQETSSPSYSIIQEYRFNENKFGINNLFHIDLFRLHNLQEVIDVGIEEILENGARCIIEWPELIQPIIQGLSVISIQIEGSGTNKRIYKLEKTHS
ncbi:MAG: tRNA (adenosine(37)-N6)-threonylcarbamoyltransferase complex ATPase subunit type 1 TsaE [Saprospiraceae bacterium]